MDVTIAGAFDSSSTFTYWLLAFSLNHPEFFAEVRAEMDQVLGVRPLPTAASSAATSAAGSRP